MEGSQKSMIDDLENIEDNFARQVSEEAYNCGLEMGKKAGQDEGYARGSDIGSKIGSEIGFYRGYTKTCIELLKASSASNDTKSTRILNKLYEILDLVDNFPHSNDTSCEDKLSDIRLKFKRHFNIDESA